MFGPIDLPGIYYAIHSNVQILPMKPLYIPASIFVPNQLHSTNNAYSISFHFDKGFEKTMLDLQG